MRIISFVVCVAIFTSTIIFLSDVAQGQETTNETKIKFEKSVELNKELAEEGFDIQYAAPYNGSMREVLIKDFRRIPKVLEKIEEEK